VLAGFEDFAYVGQLDSTRSILVELKPAARLMAINNKANLAGSFRGGTALVVFDYRAERQNC
jgi:hypothetical protein